MCCAEAPDIPLSWRFQRQPRRWKLWRQPVAVEDDGRNRFNRLRCDQRSSRCRRRGSGGRRSRDFDAAWRKIDPGVTLFEMTGTVTKVDADARFIFEGPMKGVEAVLGPSAVIKIGVSISRSSPIASKLRPDVSSLELFQEKSLVAVKSAQIPCGVRADGTRNHAGGCGLNYVTRSQQVPYQNVRRPIWPLDGEWD